MDFPLVLQNKFASGMDEFKQDITLILKNPIRMFFQSLELGNQASPHSSDEELLDTGIRNTVSQISGVTVEYLNIVGEDIELHLKYRDNIVKFQFSVNSLYEK